MNQKEKERKKRVREGLEEPGFHELADEIPWWKAIGGLVGAQAFIIIAWPFMLIAGIFAAPIILIKEKDYTLTKVSIAIALSVFLALIAAALVWVVVSWLTS